MSSTTIDAAPGAAQRELFGHPLALYVLFFTELWERFSYYGMRALLVLYMTEHLLRSDSYAYGIYGAYGSLVYATPFIGGLLADRILGYRRAIVLGGVLMAIGHFALAFENDTAFFAALAFLIVGNGFFKPNISSLVGKLYAPGDPRRDGAFTIFYMGINVGAFLAPLTVGIVGQTVGWHYGFGMAGVGMVVGLLIYLFNQRLLGEHGLAPEERPRPGGVDAGVIVTAGAFVSVPLFMWLVRNHGALTWLLLALGAVVLGVLLISAFSSERVERDRLLVVIVLIFFSVLFWAFFEQAGSSMSLYTERNVDRSVSPAIASVFGWEGAIIPSSAFQAVNPLFVFTLAPLFAIAWTQLGRRGYEPSTPLKFAAGMVLLGMGFGALVLGAMSAQDGITSVWWLILGYLLHTMGELCLSPVGLSMVTKLAPAKIVGAVMGAWFLSSSFAHLVGAFIASLTGTDGPAVGAVGTVHATAGLAAGQLGGLGSPAQYAALAAAEGFSGAIGPSNLPPSTSLPLYSDVFGTIALVAVAAGVLCALLVPLLKRWMHGVN